jgi:Ca-activated chloride channel family protein
MEAVQAQSKTIRPLQSTRVLFLLDASGSMADAWTDEDGIARDKFAVAKELLIQAIDSVVQEGKPVEFGLRVFGHQSARQLKDCEDTKLEVSFARDNRARLRTVLDRITPQGWTPIAYSLFLAAHDFPEDKRATNVVVLITDGLENCDGDPCAASEALRNQRIALRPYVIGLGLSAEERAAFDCVGTYYDAAEPERFEEALNVVISQALRNTTVQLNLLDELGRARETDVEVTFYDSYSREALEHYVHTTLRSGVADTLYLDPAGRYDAVAHTTPPVAKRNIELTAGQHNIIALDVPQGSLNLMLDGYSGSIRLPETSFTCSPSTRNTATSPTATTSNC